MDYKKCTELPMIVYGNSRNVYGISRQHQTPLSPVNNCQPIKRANFLYSAQKLQYSILRL